MEIRIAAMNTAVELLIKNPDRLAEAFFRFDPSSMHPKAYDAWIQHTTSPSNRITADDITAINATMAARSPLKVWRSLLESDADLPELAAIDPAWDLFAMPEEEWQRYECRYRIGQLFTAIMGPGRNLSVTTKVLHIKRPRCIPVLDSLVVQMVGSFAEPGPEVGAEITAHLREQGRANLGALIAIQRQLAATDVSRTLVRILDALLWLSHPGAWGSAAYQHLGATVSVLDVDGKTSVSTGTTVPTIGQRLQECRDQIVASGEPQLSWDEIDAEVAERRGGVQADEGL